MRTKLRRRFPFVTGFVLAVLCGGQISLPAVPADSAPADAPSKFFSPVLQAKTASAAWEELSVGTHPPPTPAAWETTPPTTSDRQKFYLPFVHAVEDRAKDFYTRFASDTNASKAKFIEFRFLLIAQQLGDTGQKARADAVESSVLNDPTIKGDEHFQMLWMVAQNSEPEKALPLLKQIAGGAAPAEMKEAATGLLKQMEAIGKPMALQFTAVDGRSVDVSKLKGRVVMIDFWATWCGPCVGEVPNVKKTYEALHPKGFEIVGISLDKDKDKLTQFTAEHSMPWPQYFDGQFWQNKYARQFGINSIPAMWLIDKKGDLRTMNGREDLEGQVQKLLAE